LRVVTGNAFNWLWKTKSDLLHFLRLVLALLNIHLKAAPVALKVVKKFVEHARQHGDRVPGLIQFFLFQEEAYVCYVKALSDLGFRLSCVLG
jgi:hypothetical protein